MSSALETYGSFREDAARLMIALRRGEFSDSVCRQCQADVAQAIEGLLTKHPGIYDLAPPREPELDEDDLCTTECGCYVELDGHCVHGNPSLALTLGLV